MAKRGLWTALKESYRKRLEKNGITRRMYESGASLSKARGHGKTPEHPEDAYKGKNAEKYAEYRYRKAQRKIKTGIAKRQSAVERAREYADKPEWARKKPYWPGNEEAAFWREYQRLGGVGKVA